MSIVLIGGGSRSGKSRYALEIAQRYGTRRAFLATAQALDGEMAERVQQHQRDRGQSFRTIEEPIAVAAAVRHAESRFDVIVIDCLTLWLSNMMLAGREGEMEAMLGEVAASLVPCILVTNEVGCGIVPESALARRFRDLAGTLNQRAVTYATEAYWMIFGVQLRIK